MQYYTALLNSKELFYDYSGTDTAQIKALNSTFKGQSPFKYLTLLLTARDEESAIFQM